ncbi:MAG: hypothetical protein M1820_005850 [Bogoriella megaspora]|nr:MAG: hypothetical protein M1820_005850 [Bogoriella megaspora]
MARTYAENGVGLSYNVTTVFNNNQSFSLAPSPSSDAAWSSLFPKGQGYIVDPRSEAKVAGISAFHQLHCLNLLRRIYYAEKLGIKLDSHGPQLSVTHWGHCIDYLRRAIMCHADDNMEPVDDKTLQITLRDVPRKCRDYDVLKAWTEENRPPDLP